MRLRSVLCLATVLGILASLIFGVTTTDGGRPLQVVTAASSSDPFPVGMSANHRYLVDQYGRPYMIVGDSPHSLFVNTSVVDADFYLADRQSFGVNAIWVQALSDAYTGGRADGSTFDGILPFSTPGDFSTPNPAYFDRVASIIQEAENHGITAFLDPVDLAGWNAQMGSNGPGKDQAFGAFLGNRFKSFPNIVWLNGNDFQNWGDPSADANALALAQGIASADPNHVQTIELNYNQSSSLDDQRWAGALKLNAAYSYYVTYDEVLHAYNQTPTMPTFVVEANYEGEDNTGGPATTAETLRRQEWWAMTSGATGQLYGNHTTWTFPSGWKNMLDTPGVAQLSVMRSFFLTEPWQLLVPDSTFITSGQGTYSGGATAVTSSNYATAALSADGAHAVVYVPSAQTVTVNKARLAANVSARWIDPTTGASQPATAPYTTPGTHPDGASDWALVFDAPAIPPTMGYWSVASDGGVFSFGTAGFFGSTGNVRLNRPIVAMAPTPSGRGYWLVASDGGVFTFGDAGFFGSTGNVRLNRPIVAMAPTPSGRGYWLVASDGGVFTFGDAGFYGSTGNVALNRPIVAMAPTPSGRGYWLVASDGGVFTFGDAGFYGSTGGIHLSRPIVAMARTPSGRGYWLVASDGGVFTFGDAGFYGSTGGIPLNLPIVAMARTPSGRGYWLVASDGGVFTFGDAGFYGSTGGIPLNLPIVGSSAHP